MGKNWAIVIGINNYDNLQPLKYAKRDAEVMAAWFKEEAQFEQVFLFTEDSPPIPTNPPIPTQPTFGRLRRFLQTQFENTQQTLLKPGDNLWFFFAGHGRRFADQDYLMLPDSNPAEVENTAISVDYVTQRLRRSGADNVVLFLDACRDQGDRMGLGIGEERHQGVITFYSCTANQQSWEIDELQHGSFTHTLLQGLRLHGEANCATVERLEQYLRYQVPQLNVRYGKPAQHPYLQAEPPYKMYLILLEQAARLKDVEPLKYQASLAENKGDLLLAEQLWVRVLAVSRGDWDAFDAIKRIAVRQGASPEPIISISEPMTASPSGERSVPSEPTQESQIGQQAEAHRQNLVRYKQEFTKAIEQEFPLSEPTRGRLRNLQESLQLSDEEISQIERIALRQQGIPEFTSSISELVSEPIGDRSIQEIENFTPIRFVPSSRINRKQFLIWTGLGGAGLVTAVVGHEIFKNQSPTPEPTNQPADQPTTFSVVAPKKPPPTEGSPKVLGDSTTQQEIRLEVQLKQRKLFVYRDQVMQASYLVATGKKGWETPTGNFVVRNMLANTVWRHAITGKLFSDRGDRDIFNPVDSKNFPEGSSQPLGDPWIGFWSDGRNQLGFLSVSNKALLGKAISHGSILLFKEDLVKLYKIVKLGTPVIIY